MDADVGSGTDSGVCAQIGSRAKRKGTVMRAVRRNFEMENSSAVPLTRRDSQKCKSERHARLSSTLLRRPIIRSNDRLGKRSSYYRVAGVAKLFRIRSRNSSVSRLIRPSFRVKNCRARITMRPSIMTVSTLAALVA